MLLLSGILFGAIGSAAVYWSLRPKSAPPASPELEIVTRMMAFEIKVNGKKVCTAGIRAFGNLCAHLNWSRGPQVALSTAFRDQDELLEFTVAGVHVRHKPRKAPNLKRGFRYTESLEWVRRQLRAGDEITVRIVEASRADAPRKRKRLP